MGELGQLRVAQKPVQKEFESRCSTLICYSQITGEQGPCYACNSGGWLSRGFC